MSIKKHLFFFVVIVLFFPRLVTAKSYQANGPLSFRTQNPIYLQTIGQYPTRPTVLDRNRFSTRFDISYTNMFEAGVGSGGDVVLDMELARISLFGSFGLGRDAEAFIEVPFLSFSGGILDEFIQDYHNLFGFPNGGRDQVPNGQFTYRIRDADEAVVYQVNQQDFGLSDIVLGLKHQVLFEGRLKPAAAWTFRIKLPTGSRDKGMGSGNPDFSFGMAMEKSHRRWHGYLNLDYIVSGGNDKLKDFSYHELFAFMTAVEFSVSRPISIILQIQGSTPLLKNMRDSRWDGIPLDVVVGIKGTHKGVVWGEDLFWQWGFSKDIYSNGPSVDITTMLICGIRFGSKGKRIYHGDWVASH